MRELQQNELGLVTGGLQPSMIKIPQVGGTIDGYNLGGGGGGNFWVPFGDGISVGMTGDGIAVRGSLDDLGGGTFTGTGELDLDGSWQAGVRYTVPLNSDSSVQFSLGIEDKDGQYSGEAVISVAL